MELTPAITVAVLGAALLHAAWNAMIKSSADKLLDTALVCLGGSILTLPMLPFVALPAPASWPCLAGSMVVHVGYFAAIVGAYRAGDLSHGYPIMRGLAPVLVILVAAFALGESVPPKAWLAVSLICGGVLSLGLAGFDWRHWRVFAWAVCNAVIIAVYTLVDGHGVRVSGNPEAYVLWMFFLGFLPFALIVLAMRRGAMLRYAVANWPRGLGGGACSFGAYGIAVWAMARAPVPAVAALRECSVVFAALIGTWLLKEGHVRARLAGAVVVAAGVAMLKG